MAIILIISSIVVSTFVHLLGSIIACLLSGIKIESVQLFYGKTIFNFQTRVLNFEIGYLPTGGSVKYDVEDFNSRKLITRLLIVISGPIFVMLGAALILTIQTSLYEFLKGFEQIIVGFISPIDEGAKLINSFMEYASNNLFINAVALLSTKIAAFNLLSIPSLNGGQFIIEIFHIKNIKPRVALFSIGIFMSLTLIVVWLFSFVYWLML